MNNRLYYKNPYLTEFKAKILEKLIINDQYALVLDNTAFYPTCGGQPNDLGYIQNIPIVDIVEDNEKVIHILEEDIEEKCGDSIVGKINWERRFDHMQQHTGQHLLSGILMNYWQKETLSFHMGIDLCTLDIPFASLDEEKVNSLEGMANKIIYENRSIHHYFIQDNTEVSTEKLRKLKKNHEKLRIIEIEKLDRTACGGTHCQHTGEVGIIKITGWENRKDKTRITFLCGLRALVDYQKKNLISKELSHMLTTGVDQLVEKIDQMTREQKNMSKEMGRMEKRMLQIEAEEIKEKNTWNKGTFFLINKVFPEKSIQSLKQIAFILGNHSKSIVILGAETPQPIICFSCSKDLCFHSGELVNEILREYPGKGGGSAFMAMGRLEKKDDVNKALKSAIIKIQDNSGKIC